MHYFHRFKRFVDYSIKISQYEKDIGAHYRPLLYRCLLEKVDIHHLPQQLQQYDY